MKILLVSWYFPPTNSIAAVRLGKLTEYLISQGHDVRVIGGKEIPYFRQTLHLDIPEDRIVYARWVDINAGPRWLSQWVKKILYHGATANGATSATNNSASPTIQNAQRSRGLARRLDRFYRTITNWPDSRIGWLPFALNAGRRMLSDWRPQAIFASGPPFTTLLVGYGLSRLYRLPLIVEFRDRWSDDPYYPPRQLRLRLNRFAERAIVRHSIAISTVSEPWAATYRQKYGKPVAVFYNGFDEDAGKHNSSPGCKDTDILRIVYTGIIYPGRRDPAPLFDAISRMGDDQERIRVEFYGTSPAHVWPIAERYGVGDNVVVHAVIDRDRVIDEQRHADVLLLMQWDDPKEQGNIPGKFFEYLGALRPILVLGLEDGVPATIVGKLEAGVYCGDTEAIVRALRKWLQTKQNSGSIPTLPETVRQGFARADQFAKFSDFLSDVIPSGDVR